MQKIFDFVQSFEYDKLNQLFAQFLGLVGKHDISVFDQMGGEVIFTIDKNLPKWKNILSQLSDLSDEKASKIMVAIGADSYTACWKKTLKEVEQIVKVLEKLRNEYQEINH